MSSATPFVASAHVAGPAGAWAEQVWLEESWNFSLALEVFGAALAHEADAGDWLAYSDLLPSAAELSEPSGPGVSPGTESSLAQPSFAALLDARSEGSRARVRGDREGAREGARAPDAGCVGVFHHPPANHLSFNIPSPPAVDLDPIVVGHAALRCCAVVVRAFRPAWDGSANQEEDELAR
ncbi:MAG: hypothetical protein HY322_01365 [Betaproteobacteria bacterium]|nr:hypothetical protein [Betaproteobacteria bacterium]